MLQFEIMANVFAYCDVLHEKTMHFRSCATASASICIVFVIILHNIKGLDKNIVPEKSKHKVSARSNMVTIKLRKAEVCF